MRYSFRFAVTVLFAVFAGSVYADVSVGIGVLAFQGNEKALRDWQPTANYLTSSIEGYRFHIVPVSNDDISAKLEQKQISFLLTNPGSYVAVKSHHDINRVLTMLRLSEAGSQDSFGAVIVVRNDRMDLRSIEDLHGKRFAAVHEDAFGGWWMAAHELKQKEVSEHDLKEIVFTGFPQFTVINAVLEDHADAGTVRTGQLERFIREGKVAADDIRVLEPRQIDGFPYQLTTKLYPEWPLAVAPDVSPMLSRQVARALLNLDSDDEPNVQAGIDGWTVPLDYSSVRDLMRDLRVGPYEELGSITVDQFFNEQGKKILFFVILALVLLVVVLIYLNRRITTAQIYISDILQSIDDVVIRLDVKERVEFINPKGELLAGIDSRHAINKLCRNLFPLHHPNGDELKDVEYSALLKQEKKSQHLLMRDSLGVQHPVTVNVATMHSIIGGVSGYVAVIHDVSELHDMATKLTFQASHDWLTGLYNRRYFDEQLGLVHDQTFEGGNEHVLCYIDMDHFKVVNDTAGHVAGDQLLKHVARLLRDNIRQSDLLARLGGDEFGIILENCGLEKAREISSQIVQSLKMTRFEWNGESFNMSSSVGIALITSDESPLNLMRAADAACYTAKRDGGSRVHAYDSLDERLHHHHDQLAWIKRINHALENNEFVLHAQLIKSLKSESHLEKYELLLRMQDPDGSLIMPDAFLPAAEQFLLSPNIDRWVIRHAMLFVASVLKKNQFADYVFSINLSALSLTDDGFLGFVEQALCDFSIEPSVICFEITETATISNFESAVELVQGIKKLGCRLSLDDFGSGHSSFSYLRRLPVDYLKIDGSFVRDAMRDPVSAAMVKSALYLGNSMNIKTIAEYCETDELHVWLEELGIDFVQGYAVGRPADIHELFK